MNDHSTINAAGQSSLSIAEILAGCAAAILVIAFICCFCSRDAQRRRSRLNQVTIFNPLSVRSGHETNSTGRQTPDAVPVYTATSPLGPLSPEIVDAISRTSVEYRQTIAISILSLNQSFSHPTSPIGIRDGAAQSSVVSSIDEFAPVHLPDDSPRSSVMNDWSYEDTTDSDIIGSSSMPRFRLGPSVFPAHRIEPTPPSYDPTWRPALPLSQSLRIRDRVHCIQSCGDGRSPRLLPGREVSQALDQVSGQGPIPIQIYRLMQDHGPGQRYSRDQHLQSITSHRRAESFNSFTSQLNILGYNSPSHIRGMTMTPDLSTSRRPLSWTGNTIAIDSNHSSTSSHTSHDPPPHRTQLLS
ncbi:hypothetical protein BGZ49_000902 [Haplosporangium sp. Z 27]|nr:hypothetical protein BGZ49_000902 [Haplosporangium sp. Z 27]